MVPTGTDRGRSGVSGFIRVRGVSEGVAGKSWESTALLRAGRLENLEIVLADASVSRRHAEIRATDTGWELRDLGSTNGTFLNGKRLGAGEQPLQVNDRIHFGKVNVTVEAIETGNGQDSTPGDGILVEAAARPSWEAALQNLAWGLQRSPRPGEQLLALLRASHHLVHLEGEEELLQSILQDAVSALDAQRGAIVLADPSSQDLRLRALATGREAERGRPTYSHKLARRVFERGESILCSCIGDDPELALSESVQEGAMASVLCVLLRTPRRRLGVLHLDRSYWQNPFTPDELRLADALAASVSAGIESAQLLRQQHYLFLNTITILSQAVEMRDQYTGGHTARVTTYAQLLAGQMELPAQQMRLVRTGTPLHDIGKIGINDAILLKPGRLTPAEFEVMKTHTIKGAAILATIPDLRPVIPIVRSHHERWDGTGYPDRLTGEAIPLLARIVAVADAFDAMTTSRPYRPGKSADAAFAEVESEQAKQFDPHCVQAFLSVRGQVIHEMERQQREGPDSLEGTVF